MDDIALIPPPLIKTGSEESCPSTVDKVIKNKKENKNG